MKYSTTVDGKLIDRILSEPFVVADEYKFSPGRLRGNYRTKFTIYGKFIDPVERIIYYLNPPEPITGINCKITNDIGIVVAKMIVLKIESDVEYVSIICHAPLTVQSREQAVKECEQRLNLNPKFDT